MDILTKRIFDLVISLMLLPFALIIIAILVYIIPCTSRGNAIYTHKRVGRNGKVFNIYKLRTMFDDADQRLNQMLNENCALRQEWEANFKLENDPRITPFGKFLRRSSLDELPQIFNVLKGDMSIVGPRPVIQEELDKFYGKSADYYTIAYPGITGLWQTRGRNNNSYTDRVEMDKWYILHRSLWLDIKILISTPLVVIFGRGAY